MQLDYRGVLEVVVPEGAARGLLCRADARALSPEDRAVRDFVEGHRAWIERTARRTASQREAYEESRAAGLPASLDFPLCKELWLVEYRPTQARSVTAKPDGLRRIQGIRQVFALRLSGATSDEGLCRRALVRFVARRAKEAIPPFAWEVCREVGASPRSITVNNRKSAWGVCTHAGDIRIDRRVLFLPADLARQIVLHEAAHLMHLDHSVRFYEELYSYEGSTQEAERAVKQATPLIPAWLLDA
ncbi:MAG: M48 family metallopeptidase [Coriobacteriales bacterium]|nr:M48 family metallopeptidase [Coriobacteriales bacterium]